MQREGTTMSRILRSAGALVAAAALTSTALVPAAHAEPRVEDAPAAIQLNREAPRAGAGWLAGELEGGLLHNSVYDFDDYGLTIDAALALGYADLTRKQARQVKRIAPAVAKNVDAYLGTPDTYAGAAAKSLVLAVATDSDPRSFGGVDLVTRLEGRVTAAGPSTGRIADQSSYGDYANTVGQAYAVQGLSWVDSDKADEATAFLLAQQCQEGWFRLYFNADPAAAGQACASGTPGSEPDTDATAIALLSLALTGQDSAPVQRALRTGRAWLLDQQRRNGSFGGGTSTSKPNANSTGLAGTTLGFLGERKAAAKAAVWVRKLQPADLGACRSPLARDRGAIAYDRKALAAGRTDGLTGDAEDQWRRTTAQALPVLGFAPAARGKLSVAAPDRVRPGSKVRLTVRGLAKGESACVSIGSTGKRIVGKGKAVSAKLRVPKGKVAKVKVRTLTGKASTRLAVRR